LSDNAQLKAFPPEADQRSGIRGPMKDKELFPLFGIVTVLNTPFKRNGDIDPAGLERHIEYAMESGVAGFLVPAMASEVYKLSDNERLLLVETTLKTCAGRAVVIGGAGETDSSRRVRIVEDLLKIGCRNILLQIPFSEETRYREDVFRIDRSRSSPDAYSRET